MHLTQREKEKLLVYLTGQLAHERKKKGLKLNYPEAMAVISADTSTRTHLMRRALWKIRYPRSTAAAFMLIMWKEPVEAMPRM